MNYPIVTHKQKNSDYGVTIPDLPGCFSAGSTMDEALAMAKEAIELHIEGLIEQGQLVPDPSPIEKHQHNPDYAGGTWVLITAKHAPMRKNYDFSTGRANPYAARLKKARHP